MLYQPNQKNDLIIRFVLDALSMKHNTNYYNKRVFSIVIYEKEDLFYILEESRNPSKGGSSSANWIHKTTGEKMINPLIKNFTPFKGPKTQDTEKEKFIIIEQ